MIYTRASSFFVLLFICANSWSSHNGAVFAEIFEQHAYGVFQYPFLGIARLNDGVEMPGLLHVWLKALRREDYLEVKGFYFMDPAVDVEVQLGHGHQNASYYDWNPTIYLQEYKSQRRHTFTVIKHHLGKSFDKFTCIDMWLNITDPKPRYRMGVDDWLRPNEFFAPQQYFQKTDWFMNLSRHLPKQSDVPHLVVGLNPIYTPNPAVWIRMLVLYVEHHMKIGFHGVMLYISRQQSRDIVRRNPQLAHALNVLLFIHDSDNAGYNPYPDYERTDWAQAHISNQMILNLWGTGAYMLITDLDEFVAFPRPTTIVQEISAKGCLRGIMKSSPKNVPQYLVWTVHYFCEEWLIQHNGQKADLEFWLQQPMSTFHKCYTTSVPDELFHTDPSCQARNCDWGGIYKGFVNTDIMLGYYIHYGCPVPGEAGQCVEDTRVDYNNCMFLAHFPNLFRVRRVPGSDIDRLLRFNDSSWHWMYNEF